MALDALDALLDAAIPSSTSVSENATDGVEGPRTGAWSTCTTLVATGVKTNGFREILGIEVTSSEDGPDWRSSAAASHAVSPASRWSPPKPTTALIAAVGAIVPGGSWQHCHTSCAVIMMSITPKTSWQSVRSLPHSVFDQADPKSVGAQYSRTLDAYTSNYRCRRIGGGCF
ncbi:transposase [Antrihabitans sp. YC2-6]|uniref:transposase n=1 Tax=Antrihabitans sp. YC2-6 TaxID=2799498 RepID=UPI0035A980A6